MIAQPHPRSSGVDAVPSLEEGWRRAGERLRAALGENVFNSWFASLRLDEIALGRARFSVSTRFLKSWIENHYQDRLLSALNSEFPSVTTMEIFARSGQPVGNRQAARAEASEPQPECASPKPSAAKVSARAPAPVREGDAKPLAGSPLDKRLTFDTFVSGRPNQLAFTLARKLAEGRENEATITPLFVHATVGLGKTHLLQAIAHAGIARQKSVVYLTAEAFMYHFVNALRSQAAIAFKEALRGIDVLIFDDAQFLQGRVIQTEFGHVLNALTDAGRQVVIAADRPPSELDSVDERVRSRLAGGICVEMQGLDESLRLKILEKRMAAAKHANPQLEISSDVIAFVAQAVASNGRDLEGAMNRLVAHAQMAGTPLTLATAETAVRDLIKARDPKRVRIEDIQKLVANHYNVSRADLLSSRRTAAVVMPRQIAMYLAKSLTLRSLPEIGRRFGGRDHTTVLHAVRKIDNLCNTDATLKGDVDLLKRMLQE